MRCPHSGCTYPAHERRVLTNGHEVVESGCVAGHSSFISSTRLAQIDERPIDPEEFADGRPRFPCGHLKLQNIVRQDGRAVCRHCTVTRVLA